MTAVWTSVVVVMAELGGWLVWQAVSARRPQLWQQIAPYVGTSQAPVQSHTAKVLTENVRACVTAVRGSRRAHKMQTLVERQLPGALDLLAFAVSAGESLLSALARIAITTKQPLSGQISGVVTAVDSGVPIHEALSQWEKDTGSPLVARVARALQIASERGTPLVDVLRAQASDTRAARTRALLILAGRKETAMMLPVVFLILPVIVVVAIYPGLVAMQIW